jgi:hypothetical protein
MSRFAPIWNAFNAGELSPLIDGRTDQEKYFSGCKRLRNFIPTVQGPATRRGGSRYLGSTNNDALAWLLAFEFNQAQSYILEFTDLKLRFWVNRGQLLSGGVPYEIATPWAAADLVTTEGTFALRVVQSGDIMWICHYAGAFPPYKLSRLGATNWTLTAVAFTKGPFQDVDPDNAVTVQSSAVTGAVTLTASAATFAASDVGTPFYLEAKDTAGIKSWSPHASIVVNDVRRWEGNVYQCVTVGAGTTATGDNPPVHTEGRAWDGSITRIPNDDLDDLGAEWEYLHSGWGVVQITGFTDTTHVTGTVTKRLPANVVSVATQRWALSAFSASRGWPIGVTFFRQRLVYAKTLTLYLSVVGDEDDFSAKDGPDVTAETALVLKLTTNRFDLIRWIMPSAALLVGTARNELSVQEQTTSKVFAADNVVSVPQTEYGSRLLEPLRAGNAVLFVQRAGRKLREMIYDYASDRYKADDLSVLSEHVMDIGIVSIAFQQEPDSIVWCVLADGTMAALTYNRERGVIAWVPHAIGGPSAFVESVAVISKPDGRRDDVWISVRRTINGGTKRYVEIIEDNRLIETDTADGLYGDAGITYAGAPTLVVAGLGHLEGATVQVLADGSAHPDRTVVGGSITLARSASKVQIGFDSPAQLQTMRLDGGTQDGSAQTRSKSIAELWLRLKDTIGGLFGPAFDRLDPIPGLAATATVGTLPELFTGDKGVTFPAQYDTDGYICIESSPMLPITVTGLIARAEVND